jgi:Protein of unknown function (DUF2946)
MDWFRSRARGTAFLALFALALQLVLSFGHLHLEQVLFGSEHASKLVDGQPTVGAASTDDSDEDHPKSHSGAYCAICAIVHLTRCLLISDPPSLLLPKSYLSLQFEPENEAAAVELACTPFQARAPPIV